MNAELIETVIALVLAGIVFLICFFAFHLGGKSKKERFIEKAAAAGCIAKGVAVKAETRVADTDDHNRVTSPAATWVTYEYMVSGKKYNLALRFEGRCLSGGYPQDVTFYYDKRNPQKALTGTEQSRLHEKQGRWVATIILTILVYKLAKMM